MKIRTPTNGRTRAFERSYRTALGERVKTAKGTGGARRIGTRARRLGVETLALARMHDRAAASLAPSAASTAREESFFGEVVAAIDAARNGASEVHAESERLSELLTQRTGELSAALARIARETARRIALEAKLSAEERDHRRMLERSHVMESRLRQVSRRLLSAQEEERRRISRDLHDAIGQTLTGINVGLARLQQGAASNSRGLGEAISLTQQLVERSMKSVHKFAWELRPTVLDDLGLVPALRSYCKAFAERTGIEVRFAPGTVGPTVTRLDGDARTALYRVAQGALSNVERHARAQHASVRLRSVAGALRLEVRDDGRSFDAARLERSERAEHLGLLVMRERVEMVGGTFRITSKRGLGTVVRADIPLGAVGGIP